MRIYLATQKEKGEPVVTPQARDTLQTLVREQVNGIVARLVSLFLTLFVMGKIAALQDLISAQDRGEVLHTAEQAASGYFAREFEGQ